MRKEFIRISRSTCGRDPNTARRKSLDHNPQVKKAIDEMTAALTQEQADEVKHRDFCVDELNSNEVRARVWPLAEMG